MPPPLKPIMIISVDVATGAPVLQAPLRNEKERKLTLSILAECIKMAANMNIDESPIITPQKPNIITTG